jgi:hypothetical protein
MKKLLLPFFFVGTIVMMVVMAKTGAPLKTDATPLGILDLEFAYNTTKTEAILKAWDWESTSVPTGSISKIDIAEINTYFDFLFLFFYAGFLFLACKKIAAKTTGSFSKAGYMIAKGALYAGGLDIIENAGMLLTLSSQGSAATPFTTTVVSVIKWALAIIAVLYVLIGLLALAFRKN